MKHIVFILLMFVPLLNSCSKSEIVTPGAEPLNSRGVQPNEVHLSVAYSRQMVFMVNNIKHELMFKKKVWDNKTKEIEYCVKSSGKTEYGSIIAENTYLDDHAFMKISDNGKVNGFKESDIKCVGIEENEVILILSPGVMVGIK